MPKSAPTIKLSDELTVEVVDPDNISPIYADIITELRFADGVLCLSLGSYVVDAYGEGKVRVTSRIRIPISKAAILHDLVQNILVAESGAKSSGEVLN